MKPYTSKDKWNFLGRNGAGRKGIRLYAYWEIDGDPISDNYDWQTPANEIFEVWLKWLSTNNYDCANQLVPIYWYIASFDTGIFESAPFCYAHHPTAKEANFLSYYSWPTHGQTGTHINWLKLPVIDKLWSKANEMKGGFIQEHTGWKPGIYQPFVYLQSLLQKEL